METGAFEKQLYTLLSFDLPAQIFKTVKYHHMWLEKLI